MNSADPEYPPAEFWRIRARVLSYYTVICILCLFGIAVLVVYSINLGPLVGPGVEESFGLAVGAMFLFGALMVHLLDRAYREWPLGRRVHPPQPVFVTDRDVVTSLIVVVLLGAGLLIAYLLSGILGT